MAFNEWEGRKLSTDIAGIDRGAEAELQAQHGAHEGDTEVMNRLLGNSNLRIEGNATPEETPGDRILRQVREAQEKQDAQKAKEKLDAMLAKNDRMAVVKASIATMGKFPKSDKITENLRKAEAELAELETN